ncbi:hypothetical protein FisN_2Lh413 [Fistulifera solaris]|uniref:Uncharacterized protein n=1 Tax=Fistulifera solaris TaxID=1519565 RepID=A0A1Z5JPH1_FISSO|nr:hypothetical protein FisN_2Lh413 [Fistulifera solaris]|eukprot:GAX15859.1 hypothetical protein FisN_2Lh413 [Fistulifera solaris]
MSSFWKSGMEPQQERDAGLRERVAVTAIYAEKIAAGTPVTPSLLRQSNATELPMYGMAHADVKASAAGVRGSYSAAQAYAEEAKAHRDALLAKYSSA